MHPQTKFLVAGIILALGVGGATLLRPAASSIDEMASSQGHHRPAPAGFPTLPGERPLKPPTLSKTPDSSVPAQQSSSVAQVGALGPTQSTRMTSHVDLGSGIEEIFRADPRSGGVDSAYLGTEEFQPLSRQPQETRLQNPREGNPRWGVGPDGDPLGPRRFKDGRSADLWPQAQAGSQSRSVWGDQRPLAKGNSAGDSVKERQAGWRSSTSDDADPSPNGRVTSLTNAVREPVLYPPRRGSEEGRQVAPVSLWSARTSPTTANRAGPEGPTSSSPEMIGHRVRDGDTLEALAEHYMGDSQRALEIYEENRHLLASPALLPIGVVLQIPTGQTAGQSSPSMRSPR